MPLHHLRSNMTVTCVLIYEFLREVHLVSFPSVRVVSRKKVSWYKCLIKHIQVHKTRVRLIREKYGWQMKYFSSLLMAYEIFLAWAGASMGA